MYFFFYELVKFLLLLTDVFVDVKLTTTGVLDWIADDISWSLGSCQSNRGNPGQSDYQGNQEYNQQCHFSTSPTNWVFRLTCKNTDGWGWGGAFITINGVNYCEDFLDGREKIVYIEANPSKYLSCLFQVLFFVHCITPYLCKIIAIY